MKFFKQITLLVFILTFFTCPVLAQKTPDWVNGSSEKYPEPQFFIGIGATSMDKGGKNQQIRWVNDQARSEISKILRSKIESTTSSSRHITSNQGNSANTKSTQSDSISVSTNEILEGVEIKSLYRDKKARMLYALAVLDRPKAAKAVEEKINKLKQEMLVEMETGNEFQGQNNFLLSIRHYNKALILANNINSQNELLIILHPARILGKNTTNHKAKINKILYNLKKHVKFNVQIEGPGASVKTYIIKGLSKAGFVTKGESTTENSYILTGTTDLNYKGEIQMGPKLNMQIYQADLDIEILNAKTKEIVGALTWSVNANEKTEEIASKSAIRALGRHVENNIADNIMNLF